MTRPLAELEDWRPIPGYPSYEASDDGRIRRVGPDSKGRNIPARVLRQTPGGGALGRYLRVCLCENGRKRTRNVHLLVCMAFHGRRPGPGYEADHIEGPSNAADNLRWVSGSFNWWRGARQRWDGVNPPEYAENTAATWPAQLPQAADSPPPCQESRR